MTLVEVSVESTATILWGFFVSDGVAHESRNVDNVGEQEE